MFRNKRARGAGRRALAPCVCSPWPGLRSSEYRARKVPQHPGVAPSPLTPTPWERRKSCGACSGQGPPPPQGPHQGRGVAPSGYSPGPAGAGRQLPLFLLTVSRFPAQVRLELRAERLQQLEAQEGRFAESLVSLQFQKAAWMAESLWACSALLSIQGLLLEELGTAGTLTADACTRVLDSHGPVSARRAPPGFLGRWAPLAPVWCWLLLPRPRRSLQQT